jgi:hypothetical protein
VHAPHGGITIDRFRDIVSDLFNSKIA